MSRTGLALIVLAAGLAGGVLTWDGDAAGSEPPAIRLESGSEENDTISMVWAGDTMLGDGASELLARRGHGWVLEGVDQLLDGDVNIINAEAPITTLYEPYLPSKIYSYQTDPPAAQALADAGVSALGLSNNHAMDQGPRGLADTIHHASEAGLVTFGAGQDEREAERPLLVRRGDLTIGVVPLAEGYGSTITAGPRQAGTVPLSTGSIVRGRELALAGGADWVVGYVHWGENYRGIVEEQRAVAKQFADAGYDLVIGHGAHIIQPAEVVDSMPVLYSLGNFVFGTPGSYTDENPGYGLVLETEFTATGLSDATATCIHVDNEAVFYQPRTCLAAAAAEVRGRVGLSAMLEG